MRDRGSIGRTAPGVDVLVQRLTDRRSRKVVFLSHCLLNQNTRYLGGAGRPGCVREIVEQCLRHDIGIVQMPCPEQRAWGGVLKPTLLRSYGAKQAHPFLHRLQGAILPLFLLYTRWRYRRLARRIAAEVADYVASGVDVVGIVGVDGSPSCGVDNTIDIGAAATTVTGIDPLTISTAEHNALLRRHRTSGRGLFIEALSSQLRRRHLDVPLLAHDLFDELDGRPSRVVLSRV